MPEIESLKRQIETVKRELTEREESRERWKVVHAEWQPTTIFLPDTPRDEREKRLAELRELGRQNHEAHDRELAESIDVWREVLATLERLLPPF